MEKEIVVMICEDKNKALAFWSGKNAVTYAVLTTEEKKEAIIRALDQI